MSASKKRRRLSAETLRAIKRLGREGGKIGGRSRMSKLSAEERSALARKAALARWAKRKS